MGTLLLMRFAPPNQPGYDEFFAVRNPAQPALVVLTLLCALAAAGCTLIATQAQPEKPPAVPIEFVESWGVRGDHAGQLDAPVSFAAGPRHSALPMI